VYGQNKNQTHVVSAVSDRELKLDEDGRFEVILSADEPSGAPNWMKLDSSARVLVTRQYFLDEKEEKPAELHIEALDVQGSRPPLEPHAFAGRLRLLMTALDQTIGATIDAMNAWSKQPNTVTVDWRNDASNTVLNLYPTVDNQYMGGYFRLDEDEALVIEGMPPDCRYWSIHLGNCWLESLDYCHRQVSLNKKQMKLESDGSFKVVVAHRNPGATNWLDTCGHRQGIVVFRWMQAEEAPPTPVFRVVSLEQAEK
jgi:hypothetical protein